MTVCRPARPPLPHGQGQAAPGQPSRTAGVGMGSPGPLLPCKDTGADVGGRQPPAPVLNPDRGQEGQDVAETRARGCPRAGARSSWPVPTFPHCPRPASPPETLGAVGGGSLCHVPSFTFMGVLCAVCHRHSWGTPDGMPSVGGPSSLFWSNGFLYKISCRSSLSVLFWGGLLLSLGPQIH